MLVSAVQQWESVTVVYISPSSRTSLLSPIPPIQNVTESQAGLPVLYGIPLLLHFTLLLFVNTAYFTNWRFIATFHGARLLPPFFSSSGLLCVSVSFFGNSHNILSFSITMILVIVISDQWSLMLLLQNDYMTHWRHRWWLPFSSNKVFLIKICIYFLR